VITLPDAVDVVLEFSGDHHIHSFLDINEKVRLRWDDEAHILTLSFGYESEDVANGLYWFLQEVVPKLMNDRR
jgi:hypothetical protein